MLKNIKLIFIFILINIFSINFSFAAINFVVTPIKQRIELNPGQSITKTAKIRNKGNKNVNLKVNVYDLQAENITGKPILILKRKNYIKYPEQTLKNYISLDTNEISLAPGEQKEVHFTINLLNGVTPGGHYGAVVFENYNATDNPGVTGTKVNVFYGSIILLNVNGETNIDGEIGDINVDTTHSGLGISKGIDKCPYGDFSKSNYDGKCTDLEIIDKIINPEKKEKNKKDNKKGDQTNKNDSKQDNKNNNDLEKKYSEYKKSGGKKSFEDFKKEIQDKTNKIGEDINDIEKILKNKDDNFGIKFSIPIENKGNTHLHPKGKIVLRDENGNIIKKVGKEIKTNEKGAVIGYDVVDYLPINDQDGDVFPKHKKILNVEWKGFPYIVYNDSGEQEVKYFSPSEYYTKKSLKGNFVLMPWQRVCSRINTKDITAYLDVYYLDENGEKVTTKKQKKFKIAYVENYIGYDYIKLICGGIILFILILFFLLVILNKKRCINSKCRKRIKKDMNICPYCGTIQSGKNKGKIAKFKK